MAETQDARVLYFDGNLELARSLAPSGRVRLSNAKYYRRGEYESVGVKKIPGHGYEPIHFSEVLVLANCRKLADIQKTYGELGVPVSVVPLPGGNGAPEAKAAPKAAPKAKRKSGKPKPSEFGWRMKTHPETYLAKYPDGPKAKLAREVLAKLGG